ncbi:hypothetical protein EX30DRAFT_342721 [Ascodesmis nigricans]|uniref:peptidylprolyl isomerase n=1 Tax=Ascodesmis nigricans TaxID=341454 RepID=A0A4S2MSM9_9PEZI|nr:hypothetical protein EX30DRAFT_342721 [Ascodesmis nigricans]
MRFSAIITTLGLLATSVLASEYQIITTYKPEECTTKTNKGDTISVHYRGSLESNGEEFDASYNRGTPLSFTVGKGHVIKGWDQGLLDMCIGEKRKLVIPPELGYGSAGAGGVIPGGATLIFETELMAINGGRDEL